MCRIKGELYLNLYKNIEINLKYLRDTKERINICMRLYPDGAARF